MIKEKEESGGGVARRRLWLLLAALVIVVLAVAGCGGGNETPPAETEAPPAETEAPPAETEAPPAESEAPPAESGEPIKIGISSTCEGPFGPYYGQSFAGAMLPFVDRGATPVDPADPTQGVEGAVVAGHPIEFAFGCTDATPEKALSEAQRLVEQEGVDILISPLSGSEGIAVANYAKEHPEVTFMDGVSGAQDTTLKVRAENYFRFTPDGAMSVAGLGAYAYNVLGWRNAVTIGDDYDFPYTNVGGFVAEFCSMGGNITQRLWPALGEEDYASYIADIPSDVDGFFFAVGGTGTVAFVKQYAELKGNLGDKVIGGIFMTDPLVHQELGDRVVGVTTASATSADSQEPAYLDWKARIGAAWPDFEQFAPSIVLYGYWANTEAALEALEAVGGDLSDGHAAFRDELTNLTLETPFGTVTLDENRQGVVDIYLQQLRDDDGDGTIEVKTLLKIDGVDQSFNGVFTPDTPSPDRENPKCAPGTPGPWTEGITKEAFGAG